MLQSTASGTTCIAYIQRMTKRCLDEGPNVPKSKHVISKMLLYAVCHSVWLMV